MKYIQCLFFSAILVSTFCDTLDNNNQCSFDVDASSSVVEDGKLSLPKLVQKYGYPVETHTVQTEDGYLLTIYRIPHGRQCGPSSAPKVPVLIMHGLMSSAFDFLILGPKKSLGYLLADNCYDIWLGNNRGNAESRKHVTLKPSQKEFWNFSWHEFGKYDVPAITDYILGTTNQSSLHYIGHSQGTTQFFVFGAIHPEYHHKIRTMQALSPVVYMGNLESSITKVMALFHTSLQKIADMVGLYEFLPQLQFLNLLGLEICKNDYPELQAICCNVMFLTCGYDPPQLNKTILPSIIGHAPSTSSIKQFVHYAQGIVSRKFSQFDYGWQKNLKMYNSIAPPEYELTKINIPIALYFGVNDWLSSVKDVKALAKKLPNVIENYKVPYSKFNHLDFIFATDVKHLLYNRVIQSLAAH